jgi:hypothetical protein
VTQNGLQKRRLDHLLKPLLQTTFPGPTQALGDLG